MADNKKHLKIRRLDDNGNTRVSVSGNNPAKIYLRAENVPPEHDTYTWGFYYFNEEGNLEWYQKTVYSKSVLLVLPNELITKTFEINLVTSKMEKIKLPSIKDLHINQPYKVKTKEPAEEPKVPDAETSIKLIMATDCSVISIKLMTPNGGERVPDSDGYYKLRAEDLYLKFEVDVTGVNRETIYMNAFSKGCDIIKEKAVVNTNRAIFDKIALYYSGTGIKEDTLTISVYGQNNIPPKTAKFKLKINETTLTPAEAAPFTEVVVVGHEVKVVNNNFHPCKFTDIEMKELIDDRSDIEKLKESISDFFEDSFRNSWQRFKNQEYEGKRVFKEEDTEQAPVYELVAGQGNKELTLSIKDFTTKKGECKHSPVHTQSVLYAVNNSLPKPIDVKNGLVKVEINYPYITEIISNAVNRIGVPLAPRFLPLDCFFPTWRAQNAVIKIQSCRKNVDIRLKVYPDIQWYVSAYIKLLNGIDLKSRKRLKQMFDFEEYGNPMKSSFKVGLIACWNNSETNESNANFSEGDIDSNETQNYSALFIKPLEMTSPRLEGSGSYKQALKEFTKNKFYSVLLETIRTLQDIISMVELMKLAVSIAKSVEDGYELNTTRKDLFTLEITPPDLNLAIGWRAGANNGKVGLVLEGKGNGTIVALKGTLDLFCLASKIPATRTAILALELVEWATGTEFVLNLEFSGEFSWSGELGYHEARNAWENEFAITGKIPVTLNLKMTVKPGQDYTAVTENENEYGISGTAGITGNFKFTYLSDEHTDATEGAGIYNQNEAVFDPITVIFYKKSESKDIERVKGINPTEGEGKPIVLWKGTPFWETKLTKIV